MKKIWLFTFLFTWVLQSFGQRYSSIDLVPGSPVFYFTHANAVEMVRDKDFIRQNTEIYLSFFNNAIKSDQLEQTAISPLLLRSLAQANIILGKYKAAEQLYKNYLLKVPGNPLVNLTYSIFFSIAAGREKSYRTAIIKEVAGWEYRMKEYYKYAYKKDLPFNANSILIFNSSDTANFKKAVDMRIPFFTKAERKLSMTEFCEVIRACSNIILADLTTKNLYDAVPKVEKLVQAGAEMLSKMWENKLYKPRSAEKINEVVACNYQRFDRGLVDNKNLWRNPGEIAGNKIDDDKNGVIDDIFGYQYNILNSLIKEPVALSLQDADTIALLNWMEENHKYHPEDGTIEQLKKRWWDHGSMAAELMIKNNPTVKIMALEHNQYDGRYEYITARFTDNVQHNRYLVDSLISIFLKSVTEMAQYCHLHKVRIAQISVTMGVEEKELKYKECGKDSAEVNEFAWKSFQRLKEGLTNAYSQAPNTLYVVGAGNDNADTDASPSPYNFIHLPNVLVVGALYKDMKKAAYSNYGSGVDVFAPAHFKMKNNLELLKTISGISESNGTSAASPVAANLAIQLFSLNPGLTAAEAKQLIIAAADKAPYEKGINCINPKKTVALMKNRKVVIDPAK